MDRFIIAIGGGDLKTKQTLKIDGIIAALAKKRAGERRANALFIGTASHDSMPYYNSFHKTYTGEFGLKTDCALSVYGEMNEEKIRNKFAAADMIYVGGGDTAFMLEQWKKSGIYELVLSAYERGVILSGLSAGAICWFENMFTDSMIIEGASDDYVFLPAIGLLKGCACPHYDERRGQLLSAPQLASMSDVTAVGNNCAVVFKNGELKGAIENGGKSYIVNADSEKLIKPIDLSEIL